MAFIPNVEFAKDCNLLKSTTECSELNCAIRCKTLTNCTASMFIEMNGNCILVAGDLVSIRNSSNSSIRAMNDGNSRSFKRLFEVHSYVRF